MKTKFMAFALRNLLRHKSRNILTGLSITMGTAALILGFAFTDGIIVQTIKGFTGTVVEDIVIYQKEGRRILEHAAEAQTAIGDISGIDYIIRKVQFNSVVFSRTSSVNARIIGVGTDDVRRRDNLVITAGEYLGAGDSSNLIISQKLARRLKVDVGDKLALVVNMPGGGTNAMDLRVGGIFTVITGLQFVDHLIYVSLSNAQALMGLAGQQFFSLGVYLTDIDTVDRFEKQINARLDKGQLGCKVASWKTMMAGVMEQYYLVKYIVLIFTLIFLAVICVGVVNAGFISVSERTREIGTLMAMGARQNKIIALFLLEGAVLSLISASLGSGLGVGVVKLFEIIGVEAPTRGAVWIFGGSVLNPHLSPATVLFCFGFVAALNLAGIAYPIVRASRMNPTEALDYV
jgi:putative ABC transport system permease protein